MPFGTWQLNDTNAKIVNLLTDLSDNSAMVLKFIKFLLPVLIIFFAFQGAKMLFGMRQPPEQRAPDPVVTLVQAIQPQVNNDRFAVQAQGTVQPRTETTLVAE
ncbi:MAG: hypothetical protein F6K31_24195, partial [Symploca sp. SIO2G7]|nr:hypothetical protein [Symploca sp. SIO2G7]